MESLEIKRTGYNGTIDKLNSHFFFLGNPEEIKLSANLETEELKKRLVMFLLDTLYNLELSTQKKLQLLEPFSLTGNQIKQEIKMINNLNDELNNFFINMFGYNFNEINQKLQENEEKDRKILQYKNTINDLINGKLNIEDLRQEKI